MTEITSSVEIFLSTAFSKKHPEVSNVTDSA